MSYSPPTNRSKYGDTDFSDDTWTPPTTGGIKQAPLGGFQQPGGYQPQAPIGSLGQSAPPVNYNTNLSQSQPRPPGATAADIMKSLTQEDILFMRSWQMDSFFYRVLPLNVVSCGGLFLYNKTKELPQKWSRFIALSVASYVIGKWSYRSDLRRRLMETRSNTPFIQELRKTLGVSAMSYGGGPQSDTSDYGYSQWETSNNQQSDFNTAGQSIGMRQPATQPLQSAFDQPNAAYNYQPNFASGSNSSDTDKPEGTNYDELRARNRGLIR